MSQGSRLGDLWEFARDVEERVGRLETWRATVEAVSGWRRWAVPTLISTVALATTIINLLHR